MLSFHSRPFVALTGLCLALSGAACSHHERPPAAASEDDRFGRLSDGQIGQVLLSAHQGEANLGQLAHVTAQREDVREFAAQMVNDHTAARANAKSVLDAQRIVPMASHQSRMLERDAAEMHQRLSDHQDPDFDGAYISAQVKMHQELLTLINSKLMPEARHVQLRGLLESTRASVESHLQMANALQRVITEDATDTTSPTTVPPSPMEPTPGTSPMEPTPGPSPMEPGQGVPPSPMQPAPIN